MRLRSPERRHASRDRRRDSSRDRRRRSRSRRPDRCSSFCRQLPTLGDVPHRSARNKQLPVLAMPVRNKAGCVGMKRVLGGLGSNGCACMGAQSVGMVAYNPVYLNSMLCISGMRMAGVARVETLTGTGGIAESTAAVLSEPGILKKLQRYAARISGSVPPHWPRSQYPTVSNGTLKSLHPEIEGTISQLLPPVPI